jgi:8-oxo-dGTP pyrophosphatase MutT (NUDIX family)
VRPAATVVVLRDGPSGPEAFLVRRHEGTAFMGGAHVFPGGRVDAADFVTADDTWCDGTKEAAARLADLKPRDGIACHVAAARELFEEAGVLLAVAGDGRYVSLAGPASRARFRQYRRDVYDGSRSFRDVVTGENLRLALGALIPFAHWVTPPVDVRRFDTRFFVARVPPEQTPAHDNTEATDSIWITAADAVARCRRDEIVLPPPTWTTLREIERFESVDDILAWTRTRRIVRREPMFVERDGVKLLLLAGDPLHPDPGAEASMYETRFVLTDGRWRARTASA